MQVLTARTITRAASVVAVLVVVVVVSGALPLSSLPRASGAQAAVVQAAGPGGGCYPVGLTWICLYGSGRPGSGGSGTGGSARYTCTYAAASQGLLQRSGTGPAPTGDKWEVMTCPGSAANSLNGQLVLVSTATGAPAISPVELLRIAMGGLRVPAPDPHTAPPRGKDGLVGLPEWFWVPRADWRKVSVTVSAGPVWADAVAAPKELTFVPGGGLASASCTGPGTPFATSAPGRQHTNCSYSYGQPSAGQQGNAYRAALVVTWTISWTGSGGAGGLVTGGYTTSAGFSVRVAQAEGLVTTP